MTVYLHTQIKYTVMYQCNKHGVTVSSNPSNQNKIISTRLKTYSILTLHICYSQSNTDYHRMTLYVLYLCVGWWLRRILGWRFAPRCSDPCFLSSSMPGRSGFKRRSWRLGGRSWRTFGMCSSRAPIISSYFGLLPVSFLWSPSSVMRRCVRSAICRESNKSSLVCLFFGWLVGWLVGERDFHVESGFIFHESLHVCTRCAMPCTFVISTVSVVVRRIVGKR